MSFAHDTNTDNETHAPQPVTALLFYSNDQSVFAMEHGLYEAQGRVRISAGRVLDSEQFRHRISDLGEAMIPDTDPVVLDRTIVAADERFTAWVRPAGVTRMLHRDRDGGGLVTLTVPWPRLLFTVTRERALLITAIPGDGPVTGDTPLAHAPFGNVYHNTALCQGSVVYPEGWVTHDLDGWEAAFTDSTFSHPNHGATMNANALAARELIEAPDHNASVSPRAHFALWHALDGATSFPEDVLNPLGLSVKEYLRKVTRRR
jgi:PRTRC genetic system protein B